MHAELGSSFDNCARTAFNGQRPPVLSVAEEGMSEQIFWSHRCNIQVQDGNLCPKCNQPTAWNGRAIMQIVEPLTEEEIRVMVRDQITVPSLRELMEQGLIGGSSTVTYPKL